MACACMGLVSKDSYVIDGDHRFDRLREKGGTGAVNMLFGLLILQGCCCVG